MTSKDSNSEQFQLCFLNPGYQFNDICLAIRILGSNPSTTYADL